MRFLKVGQFALSFYKVMETKELSQKVYDIVVDEVDRIYPKFMKRVNDIDIDYFEGIIRDSEKLPKELNFELRDKVLDDVRLYAMQLLEESGIRNRIENLMKDIDEETAKEVLGHAKEKLREYAAASSFLNGSSTFMEEDLQKLYTDAKKQDLWERITQNNKADVIKFHHALMDMTYEQCKDLLYGCIESFL